MCPWPPVPKLGGSDHPMTRMCLQRRPREGAISFPDPLGFFSAQTHTRRVREGGEEHHGDNLRSF